MELGLFILSVLVLALLILYIGSVRECEVLEREIVRLDAQLQEARRSIGVCLRFHMAKRKPFWFGW